MPRPWAGGSAAAGVPPVQRQNMVLSGRSTLQESSVASQLSPGAEVANKKYKIDAFLGAGVAGETYAARTHPVGKKVVFKLLHAEAKDLGAIQAVFDRARAAKSEGLATLLEVGLHEGRPFVVQEAFEGESLRQLMEQYVTEKRKFTLQEAAQIVVKVLEAAEVGHAAGLIHRHIKPTNVIIQSKTVGPGKVVRSVQVSGLGIADMVPASGIADRADDRYLAPEFTNRKLQDLDGGSAKAGPQSDVYSCGVLLYELLTGQTPRGTYLSPSQIRDDLPPGVDDIVDLALAANVEDRFPTARDMVNAIQRSFQEDAPADSGMSRRLIVAIAGATLVLLLMITGAVLTSDPLADAKKSDETVRAQIVKSNPLPDEATMREKLAGHPDMAYIPAGTFLRGRLNAESAKLVNATEPLAQVGKTKAYYIDRLEHGGGTPVVNVTMGDASRMCVEAGKRLCTSDEWERACKGPESRIYTYGDVFSAEKCGGDVATDANKDGKADRGSGTIDTCQSGWGAFDMSGNAREWTSSADPSQTKFRVIKGGKASDPERGSRCAYADSRSPESTDRTIGFRCCQDAAASAPPAEPPVPTTPADAATPTDPAAPGTPAGVPTTPPVPAQIPVIAPPT